MPGPEQRPQLPSDPLPPELVEAVRNQEYACLTISTQEYGTALFIKAPAWEIQRIPSPVPIRLQHLLYQHQLAPVIRMLVTIYDQPGHPLAMDTFINVQDPQQRADYAALAGQEQIPFLFHDEALRRRRAITVGNGSQEQIRQIVTEAERLWRAIPPWDFDFDMAKAAVMRSTGMR